MNILWFVAKPVGTMLNLISDKKVLASSGGWVDVAAALLDLEEQDKVTIASTVKATEILREENKGITYIYLPCGDAYTKKEYSKNDIDIIDGLIKSVQPDIVQIWGTETLFSSVAAKCAAPIPVLVYMQGVLSAIAKYPNGYISRVELCGGSLMNCLMFPRYNRSSRAYARWAQYEADTLRTVLHVISDNEWCFSWCRYINPDISCHYSLLPFKPEFFESSWEQSQTEPMRIFTIADRGGYKGIDKLLKAIAIVMKIYPDIVLAIPGRPIVKRGAKIKLTDIYAKYIYSLIDKNNLWSNIEFVGMQDAEGMVSNMRRSAIFVMPSAIENHSSSLREAMAYGMPCITSNAGSSCEVLRHGYNGIMYRFEEYEILAQEIIKLFSNPEQAQIYGENARSTLTAMYNEDKDRGGLMKIYEEILNT